jgi:ribosomal protein S18 acetylase RimI-like enzyme
MTLVPSFPQPNVIGAGSIFARAIETDRIYFELGANAKRLPGAVLAWMPGLADAPAGAVIHRVEPEVIAAMGANWVVQAERALAEVGAELARIYLDARDGAADEVLRLAGYADRDELVFAHTLPEETPCLILRPVKSDEDWERKLRFHEETQVFPDGHSNRPSEWVALERRKCADGMDAFLAEADGETVGAIGAVWGDRLLRMKNIVVHPAHRRRSNGRAMLAQIAAIGRERGVSEQCILAVRGDAGELLYRAAGMQVVGSQVEWSKQIGGSAQ